MDSHRDAGERAQGKVVSKSLLSPLHVPSLVGREILGLGTWVVDPAGKSLTVVM